MFLISEVPLYSTSEEFSGTRLALLFIFSGTRDTEGYGGAKAMERWGLPPH